MNVKPMLSQINRLADAAGHGPVTLVAATKMQSAETVRAAIAEGLTDVGENRVQELLDKWRQVAYTGARLHFIGHLQRNKVRDIIDKVDLMQSLDSLPLAQRLNDEAARIGRVLDVLVQVKLGDEDAKHGFAPDEVMSTVQALQAFPSLRVRGLMSIPPPALQQLDGNKKYFSQLCKIYVDNKEKIGFNNSVNFFNVLSMGMSDDYAQAIAAGATMVRVGTALFGQRNYNG